MAPTSTPLAARWCSNSARPAGCATRWPASPMAALRDVIDTRMICLVRETLARHNGLADFAFAMQGLGSGAISLAGTPEQKAALAAARCAGRGDRRLRAVRARGRLRCRGAAMRGAQSTATHAVLDGEKTWISNGGIADFYVVFARSGEAPGERRRAPRAAPRASPPSSSRPARRASRSPSASTSSRRTRWRGCASTNCRVPLAHRIGAAGEGFKIAMRTLDVFRTRVAAAALGFARRALDEALARATQPPDVRPARWPTSSSRRPGWRRWPPRSTAPRC